MSVSTNGEGAPRIPAEVAGIQVIYNYLEVGDDKNDATSMRLGLAKGKVKLTEIMTFEGD